MWWQTGGRGVASWRKGGVKRLLSVPKQIVQYYWAEHECGHRFPLYSFKKNTFSLRSRNFFETWGYVTMLAKEKKTHCETPKRIFLSIAGCVVDPKFVSIILDIAITVLISPADFFCRWFFCLLRSQLLRHKFLRSMKKLLWNWGIFLLRYLWSMTLGEVRATVEPLCVNNFFGGRLQLLKAIFLF